MTPDSSSALTVLQEATHGTPYEGRLFLVGGYVRDQVLNLPSASDDLDIVLEGDALALAEFLWERKAAQYHPVVYPRFGTAMIVVQGQNVELVTARIESYAADSRKPVTVQWGTLADDALRRDFTINTLLQNLHTGEILDPLGAAYADLQARTIRTPTDPSLTFADDPLRMLRAVRFAVRLGFEIAPPTWEAILVSASRLTIISFERVRDEFIKILMNSRARLGMELLQSSGLLQQFAPELTSLMGVTQNSFHIYDVWTHTLAALESLPEEAPPILRLATLFHDLGKPRTRTVDTDGHIHFYHHQEVGEKMTRTLMRRLKFSNDDIEAVARLVAEHMRIGEYGAQWSDAAVRRLIRDLGASLPELFALHAADVAGLSPENQDISRAYQLRDRIAAIQQQQDVCLLSSPLSGLEIMALLDIPAGKKVGVIKDYLTSEVVEGRLQPDDKFEAMRLAYQLAREL